MSNVAQVLLAGLAIDAAFLTSMVLVIILFRRLAASRRASAEREKRLEETFNELYARLTQVEDRATQLERNSHIHVNSGKLAPPPAPFYPDIIDPGHTRRASEH